MIHLPDTLYILEYQSDNHQVLQKDWHQSLQRPHLQQDLPAEGYWDLYYNNPFLHLGLQCLGGWYCLLPHHRHSSL